MFGEKYGALEKALPPELLDKYNYILSRQYDEDQSDEI